MSLFSSELLLTLSTVCKMSTGLVAVAMSLLPVTMRDLSHMRGRNGKHCIGIFGYVRFFGAVVPPSRGCKRRKRART